MSTLWRSKKLCYSECWDHNYWVGQRPALSLVVAPLTIPLTQKRNHFLSSAHIHVHAGWHLLGVLAVCHLRLLQWLSEKMSERMLRPLANITTDDRWTAGNEILMHKYILPTNASKTETSVIYCNPAVLNTVHCPEHCHCRDSVVWIRLHVLYSRPAAVLD